MEQTDDQILEQAFRDFAEGIILGDWQVVCDAYNKVTGQNLEPYKEPAKPISKLAKLRSALADNPEESTEALPKQKVGKVVTVVLEDPTRDWSKMTVADIKIELIAIGAPEPEFMEIKGKKDLVSYAADFSKKQSTVKKTTVPVKNKSKFARGVIEIIGTPESDEEKMANAREKAKSPRGPVIRRNTELKPIKDKGEGGFNFDPNPSKRNRD